ncbi:MAG: FAD-binding oxidoreductase [Gammaproteobacteria bacterium]
MKRREFCKTAVAAGTLASLPISQAMAAALDSMSVLSSITATRLTGQQTVIDKAAVKELRDSLEGQLLMPGNGAYEVARRLWNGMIDKHPALIAYCANAADIAHAVSFASDYELLVAIKGGAHSFSGKSSCDGGLMIDLSGMKGIDVDAEKRIARVQPGVLGGELDAQTQPHGLAAMTGTVAHTGIAGLTLGGGLSRVSRKYGLMIDSLRSADIVTADGRHRHASADENPDLFWALRGGGGNFGVVTSFEYDLHPVGPEVLAGSIVYPYEQGRDLLSFYQEFAADASDELNVAFSLGTSPEGERFVSINIIYAGAPAAGERAIEPLRRYGRPMSDNVGLMQYNTLQTGDDEALRHGQMYYLKSGFVNEYTPELIDDLLGNLPKDAAVLVFTDHLRGAISRVGQDDTAFAHRNAFALIGVLGVWAEPARNEANIAKVRGYYNSWHDHTIGYYTNLNEEGEKRTHSNYGANYPRLVAIKDRYDPKNMFRLNANISPSG